MKKLITLLMVLSLVFALLTPFSVSAAEVYVTHAKIGIVVNGKMIDNSLRKFPFIVYNSITYFPMTYNDCAFLGLSNTWTPESGNIIEKAEELDIYDDFLNPLQNNEDIGGMATVAATPISVLGVKIDNSKEEYPILNYRNLLYFPLTWAWGEAFGWSVNFYNNGVLEVATESYENKGNHYVYNIKTGEVTNTPISNYKGKVDYLRTSESVSPNYTFARGAFDGFTVLYRMAHGGLGEDKIDYINVKNGLEAEFLQNGWFLSENAEGHILEYMKTHGKAEVILAANLCGLENQALYNVVQKYSHYNMGGYTTVYMEPNLAATVKKTDVWAYRQQGWKTGNEFILSLANEKESRGQIGEALKIIEVLRSNTYTLNYGSYMPYIEIYEEETDEFYEAVKKKTAALSEKAYGSKNPGYKYIYSYIDSDKTTYLYFAGKFKPGKKYAEFKVSYDLSDASGNIVQRGLSLYMETYESYDGLDTATAYIGDIDSIEFKPVNIKVYDLVWHDDFGPMGAG